MPFTLTNNAGSFIFDTDGNVTSGGAAAGSWSLDASNNIQLTPKAGAPTIFNVGWSFVANQLWLVVGGNRLFNFHAAGMPDYNIVNNQLQVIPRDAVSTFSFTLACDFSLDQDLNLLIGIGAIKSKLVGALADTQARFIYRFFDDTFGVEDALILQGHWDRDTTIDGEIHMKFLYTVGGANREIVIPRAFDVNPFTNSLRLRYEKDGQARVLELAGEIQFANNNTLIFSIKKSGMPGSSTLQVNFQLSGAGKTIKTVELTLLKTNNALGRSITIGGSLSANIGANGLTINFRYAHSATAAGVTSTALAVDGTFTLAAGGKIVFSYQKDGAGTTIQVVVSDIKVGDVATLSAAFQIVQNGQKRAVRGFISLSW